MWFSELRLGYERSGSGGSFLADLVGTGWGYLKETFSFWHRLRIWGECR